jgi:hypothetical protein
LELMYFFNPNKIRIYGNYNKSMKFISHTYSFIVFWLDL